MRVLSYVLTSCGGTTGGRRRRGEVEVRRRHRVRRDGRWVGYARGDARAVGTSAHLDRLVRHRVRDALLEALHEGRHLESIRSPLGEDARREPRARPPRETTTKTKCVRRSEEVTTRTRTPRERDAAARPEARAVLRATLLPTLRASAGRDRPSARFMARPPPARHPSVALRRSVQHSPAPHTRADVTDFAVMGPPSRRPRERPSRKASSSRYSIRASSRSSSRHFFRVILYYYSLKISTDYAQRQRPRPATARSAAKTLRRACRQKNSPRRRKMNPALASNGDGSLSPSISLLSRARGFNPPPPPGARRR